MLFRLECKKIIRSAAFLIYCVISVIFFATQYYEGCKGGIYIGEGEKIVEDHDLIMDKALNVLAGEYASNKYVCYPFGFYKAVHLKNSKQEKIAAYLKEITGTDGESFEALFSGGEKYYSGMSDQPVYSFDSIPVAEGFSYDRFTEIMADVDDILGGGSEYDPEGLVYRYSRVPMTEEEAQAEYEVFLKEDRVTGGLARLFSDYAGIMLAVLPVFVAASLSSADRKRRMHELVYTRKISSFRLVFTRYAALLVTMFIPVLLEMLVALIQVISEFGAKDIDMAVMFTLPTFWLLPILMFTTALGMLITEIFSAATAIFTQVVIWFMSMMMGGVELCGKIGKYTLVCRHNSPANRAEFLMNQDNFIFSRFFWAAVSIVIVLAAVLVYEAKRGGRFNAIRLFGEGGILRRKA